MYDGNSAYKMQVMFSGNGFFEPCLDAHIFLTWETYMLFARLVSSVKG